MINKLIDIYISVSSVIFFLQGCMIIMCDFLLTKIFKRYKGNSLLLAKLSSKVFVKSACINLRINDPNNILENNKNNKLIILFSHATFFDPIIVNAIFPNNISFIGKAELWKFKLLATFLDYIEAIKINRTNLEQAKLSYNEAKQKVDDKNLSVAVSPEGTRRRKKSIGKSEDILPFKKGPFHFAKQVNSDIVLLLFTGAKRLDGTNILSRRKGTLYVDILKKIDNSVIKNLDPNELKDYCENEMKANFKYIDDSKILDKDVDYIFNLFILFINICVYLILSNIYYRLKLIFN